MYKYYLLCCWLLAACSTPEEKSAEVSLRFVKEISFDIDSMTPSIPDGKASIFKYQGKEYYVHGNKKKFCLQFFDIQAQKLSFEVPLQREGEDGIGSFNHFFVKSLDSIYVVYSYTYSMWRINKEGKILKKYNWAEKTKGTILQRSLEPMPCHKDTLYFLVSYFNYPHHPVTQWISLKDGATGFRHKLPEMYQKANYKHLANVHSRCEGSRGEVIYSFQADPNLYITSYGSNTFDKVVAAPSQYVKEIPALLKPYNENAGAGEDYDIKARRYPRYTCLLYDPYRKVYYRLVKQERREEWDESPFSIMILDENLRVIGEEYFKHGHCLIDDFAAVTEEGLYLMLYNTHPSFNEDKIMFHCYVPEGIKP